MKHNCLKQFFVAMVTLLSSIAANAHDFEVEGIFYNILSEEDRTVEVTYEGRYSDEFIEYSGNVAIPANVTYEGTTYNVTSIGDEAFADCFDKGDHAFGNCYDLTSIEIPNSVTSIGRSAFHSCIGLTSITIPNSVTTIGENAFCYCTGLTSIEIPNSVTSIGINAFGYCGLTSIEIPNSVTKIGYFAFSNCDSLTSIEIPNSVTTIGDYAFYDCAGLTSIEIPNSVTTIGESAFKYCTSLTSVTIGNSVTTIEKSAFYNCKNLTSITIPNSVTTIGDYAFSSCESLTSVTSLIPADKLFSIDSSVFNGVDKNACTLYVPAGAKKTYAATKGWNQFTNIVELEDTNIDKVVSPNNSLYYDLSGHGVENPTRGIYIVNGKKILVK